MFAIKKEQNFILKGQGRLFNWRPVVAISLSFGLGIFLRYAFSLWFFAFGFVYLAGACIYSFLKRREKMFFNIWLTSIVMLIFFCLGGISYGLRIAAYNRDTVAEGNYFISATVKDINGNSLLLEDILASDGTNINVIYGNMRLHVYANIPEGIGIGSQISFKGDIKIYDITAYGRVNVKPILENAKYFTSISGNLIQVSGEHSFNLFYAARERLRNILYAEMNDTEASLSYAMLTGDSSYIGEGLLQNFRYGGVAHIFAVSGLHIGVIYGILCLVFRRIRVPWFMRWILIFGLLFLYSGVCGFSPSSVRALIMCGVLMFADGSGVKYDRLNSISLAALVVLIVNPVYLFSVGFQLSVVATGGIILLGGTFSRVFLKLKIPKKLASVLGICLAAQLSTFPVLLDCFGYVSLLSLVTNLLFIPAISAVYSVLFFAVIISALIPAAAGAILYVPQLLLTLAVFPLSALNMKFLMISGFTIGGFALTWYLFLLLFSDQFNLRILPKTGICIMLSLIFVIGVFCSNAGLLVDNTAFMCGDYGSSIVYIRSGANYIVSYGVPKQSYLQIFSVKYRVKELDGLIILGDNKDINAAVPLFQQELPAKTLYVWKNTGTTNSFQSLRVQDVSDRFLCGNVEAEFINEYTLTLKVDKMNILCINNRETNSKVVWQGNILIAWQNILNQGGEVNALHELYFEGDAHKFSIQRVGDLQIRTENDIIPIVKRGRV